MSSSSDPSNQNNREFQVTTPVSGRWTSEEHKRFLEACSIYGRDWKSVAEYVKSRTMTQVRSHAQKYFAKLKKKNNPRSSQKSEMRADRDAFSISRFEYNGRLQVYTKSIMKLLYQRENLFKKVSTSGGSLICDNRCSKLDQNIAATLQYMFQDASIHKPSKLEIAAWVQRSVRDDHSSFPLDPVIEVFFSDPDAAPPKSKVEEMEDTVVHFMQELKDSKVSIIGLKGHTNQSSAPNQNAEASEKSQQAVNAMIPPTANGIMQPYANANPSTANGTAQNMAYLMPPPARKLLPQQTVNVMPPTTTKMTSQHTTDLMPPPAKKIMTQYNPSVMPTSTARKMPEYPNSSMTQNPKSNPISSVQHMPTPRFESGVHLATPSVAVSPSAQRLANRVAISSSGSTSGVAANTTHSSGNGTGKEAPAAVGSMAESVAESIPSSEGHSSTPLLQPQMPLCLVTMSKLDLMTYMGQFGLRRHTVNDVRGISTLVPLPSNPQATSLQVEKKIIATKQVPVAELVSDTKHRVEGYLVPTQSNELGVPHVILVPIPKSNTNKKDSYSYSMYIPLNENSEQLFVCFYQTLQISVGDMESN